MCRGKSVLSARNFEFGHRLNLCPEPVIVLAGENSVKVSRWVVYSVLEATSWDGLLPDTVNQWIVQCTFVIIIDVEQSVSRLSCFHRKHLPAAKRY